MLLNELTFTILLHLFCNEQSQRIAAMPPIARLVVNAPQHINASIATNLCTQSVGSLFLTITQNTLSATANIATTVMMKSDTKEIHTLQQTTTRTVAIQRSKEKMTHSKISRDLLWQLHQRQKEKTKEAQHNLSQPSRP